MERAFIIGIGAFCAADVLKPATQKRW